MIHLVNKFSEASMKIIQGLKKICVIYAEYFGLSTENSFSIIFPIMMGSFIFIFLLILASLLGMNKIDRVIVIIGITLIFCFFGLSGIMIAIRREVPGRPALRGSIWALVLGIITALAFISGGMYFLIIGLYQ